MCTRAHCVGPDRIPVSILPLLAAGLLFVKSNRFRDWSPRVIVACCRPSCHQIRAASSRNFLNNFVETNHGRAGVPATCCRLATLTGTLVGR